MQITVRNMRKYSITLVFSSWSDSCHVSARITFYDYSSQLSQILTSVAKFSFWNLLGEFKDGHRHGVPTAWGDVYPTSVSALFARWCRSTARMCRVCFPSLHMLLVILLLPTSSYNWALDQVLAWSCPFMVDFHSSEPWMENFNSITWISSSMELCEQTH
jgi:hypothetical protein